MTIQVMVVVVVRMVLAAMDQALASAVTTWTFCMTMTSTTWCCLGLEVLMEVPMVTLTVLLLLSCCLTPSSHRMQTRTGRAPVPRGVARCAERSRVGCRRVRLCGGGRRHTDTLTSKCVAFLVWLRGIHNGMVAWHLRLWYSAHHGCNLGAPLGHCTKCGCFCL